MHVSHCVNFMVNIVVSRVCWSSSTKYRSVTLTRKNFDVYNYYLLKKNPVCVDIEHILINRFGGARSTYSGYDYVHHEIHTMAHMHVKVSCYTKGAA